MNTRTPNWNSLYEMAASQDGHFSATQAADAGYSAQLVAYHVRKGRFARVLRGVYRLVQFPPAEHEDLVALWLWSAHEGVFGFETALALHELSDVLPARAHLVLPTAWRSRRLRFPRNVVPSYANVPKTEWSWVDCFPATNPVRTILDCASAHVAPDLVQQALQEGLRRGLFARIEVEPAERYVATFGETRT